MMRYFILSDIHANLPALEAVLQDMRQEKGYHEGDDHVVVLGDMVGYAPFPNEVMDIVYKLPADRILGNHEIGVHHILNNTFQGISAHYNERATWALNWTANQLSEKNKTRIADLMSRKDYAASHRHMGRTILFAHSEPKNPSDMTTYIECKEGAKHYFFRHAQFAKTLAFVGHLHVPQAYFSSKETSGDIQGGVIEFRRYDKDLPLLMWGAKNRRDLEPLWECQQAEDSLPFEKQFALRERAQALFVVPSVGQPRDHLPYAGYAVFDTRKDEVFMRRVHYDVESTQKRMGSFSFPSELMDRLAAGR